MSQPRVEINGFTRPEVMRLSGCDVNRLAYLERVGLVVPTRMGSLKKPTILYTWEQLLEVRAIRELRKEKGVSLQTIRSIVQFLNQSGVDDTLRDKQLVVLDDEVFWVDYSNPEEAGSIVLKVAGRKKKGIGQFVLLVIPPLSDIVGEIWEAAEQSNVVDFESFKARAKARPA